MKVTVTEIRKAKFINKDEGGYMCRVDFEYEIFMTDGTLKKLYSKSDLDAYLQYLEAAKEDYKKVIKEIEI